MARVKNGATTKARHKKVLKQAKGYFGSNEILNLDVPTPDYVYFH